MNKKIVAIPTLVAFVIFSFSCTRMVEQRVDTVPKKKQKKIKVIQVVKNSGETINFPEKEPGRIIGDSIAGTHKVEEFILDKNDVKATKRDSKGYIVEITTKEGKTFQVISVKQKEGKLYITSRSDEYAQVSIPLSEVKDLLIKFKKFDLSKTVLLSILVIVGYVVAASPSCWRIQLTKFP